jgi:T-complex protein 1 subunit theta
MIGLLGAFWLWNQEKVPITGRKRFNFISHEYLENNEHKNFLKSLLLHYTMAITQHKPSVLLPADHPMNVVVQKVFYRLLKAQGQDSSGWKICVVRARGNSYPFASGHESQRLTFSGIDRVLGAANNQVLVYTGALPVCQDEAGLASAIAHQIAACIMEPHSEVISHHYFVRLSAVPAIPLVIPAFLLPQTAVIAVSYLALWVAYAWTRDAACKTLVEQGRYAGTMVMARARYGIHAGIGYWVRYLERAERKIAEIGRLNSPIHREVHNKSLTWTHETRVLINL